MKTTLYSLNLVQLDHYLSIRPLAADSVAESARAVQMAIDHWLLEQHKLGLFPPILRFYTWSPPAISLGYHQSWPEYWQLNLARRTLELVRRLRGTGSAAPRRFMLWSHLD